MKIQRHLLFAILAVSLISLAVALSSASAAPLFAPVRLNLDSSGNVGNNPWLALDAYQRPVIAYTDTTGTALKLVYCDNPVCSSRTINVVDDTGTGNSAVLQLNAEGLPVISYHRGGRMYIAFCSTPTCEPGSVTVKALHDLAGANSIRLSMLLDADDRPISAYTYSGGGVAGLWVAYCNDSECDSITRTRVVEGGGTNCTSMKLNSIGNPVIAYNTTTGARLLTCTAPDCSTADTPVVLHSSSQTRYISLELDAAGIPRVVFFDNQSPSTSIRMVRCNDIACSSLATTVNFAGTATTSYTSLVFNSSGHSVFTSSETSGGNPGLRITRCTNTTCSPVPTASSLHDNIGSLGNSLQLDCAGNPVVAYYNLTAEDLRLYVDNASACAATPVPAFRGTPEATGPLEFSGAAGSSPQISIDIHNIVHATQLDVDLVSISGGYSIVSGLPIDDLAASDPAATITVQCDSAPQALGTLVLATNDPVVPTVTYDLTCTALVPEFNGSPTAPGPLAFVDIAAATPQLTVQVTNTGDTGSQLDVSLASITTPGYSIVSGLPIDDLTTIGGSATITVQCDSVPQSSGTLVLSTNDPANPTVTYNLTCTAPASGGDSGSSSDGVGAVSSASKPIAPSGVTTLQLGRLLVSLPASAIPPGQTGCEIAVKEQGSSGEYGFSLDDLVYDVKVFCDSGELNIFLDALTVCIRPSDGVPGDKNVYHRHAGQDFRAINGGSGPAGYVCGQTRTLSLFTLGQLALPATGFAPGVVTDLGAPSVAYAASDLTLSIPKLGLNPDILGVPQGPNGWDVSWLSSGQAGYLYGTAFPTWAGNSVLTAHVWNADNTPGPFHALKTLQHGDRFTIAYGGNTYTYEVRSNQLVLPSSQRPLAESEYSQITLVTCESFDPATGDYRYRRAVQAVLVDVY